MIREEDRRFRNLERKIGIFIAIALIGAVTAAVLYGLQKNFFAKKYTLHFTADRGTGFSKGMSVKLSGFRIGNVATIALNEQAMVDISLEIDRKYRTWIRSDSIVKLVKEGLVGDNIVDISVGSLDQPELKDHDVIMYVKTKGLDELADEIADKVKPVLAEVGSIISYINDPEGDLKKSIRNLEILTRHLEETRGKADRLIVSTNGNIDQVSRKAVAVIDSTGRKIDSIDLAPTLSRVNNSLSLLENKLPSLLEKADTSLDNISRISRETRILSEQAFPKIPGLVSQTEDVMLSTDRLIRSLQNTWLLRDHDPAAAQPPFIRGDSYE